jgi:hypothetical protein
MREVVSCSPTEISPTIDDLYRNQGIPLGRAVSATVEDLARHALASLAELAVPAGVVEDCSLEVFQTIYPGEGLNDTTTPLGEIYPQAHRLALFAATLGEQLSTEIQRLFEIGDLASAVMLDGAASEAAERFVNVIEARFAGPGSSPSRTAVLAYSPGYCGWHVSGQKKLFDRLRPAECGITLNSSFLMSPLKSVSGVLVAGRPEIHEFTDDFECCSVCVTRECRGRIERALEV